MDDMLRAVDHDRMLRILGEGDEPLTRKSFAPCEERRRSRNMSSAPWRTGSSLVRQKARMRSS